MRTSDIRADESLSSGSMSSPIGPLRLFASGVGLRAIVWADEDPLSYAGIRGAMVDGSGGSGVLEEARRQIEQYFAGTRREFDIPLDPVGTDFQRAAWKVLTTIPFGRTISYGEQARALGDARKARAVGGANGRNPIPIVVPCHRVIGSDGSLTGFAIGVGIKQYLLDFERRQMSV